MKLFRKIRFDLMQKNKTRKYIKYAVGEIFLVVIGILIALAINGWKQKSIDLKSEEFYLKNLLDNLTQDEDEILSIIDFQDRRKEIRSMLYELLDDGINNKQRIDSLYKISSDMNLTFFPNTSAFNSLKMSGDFGKIRNKDLQLKLSTLYDKIYYRLNYNAEFYDNRVENTAGQVMEFYDWDKRSITDWELATNGSLKNIIAFEQDYNRFYVSLLESGLKNISHLKEQIENELEQF